MHRLRLTLISHVWKLARRSNVSSDRKIFRKMSCVRSSACSCDADELVRDVEHLPPVLPDDLLPGQLIAAETLLDQRVDGGRLWREEVGAHEVGVTAGPAMITKQFSPCQSAQSGRIASVITAASAFRADASLGLCCDGVPLSEIAARVGTPTYVYSAASIRSAWTRLDAAFGAAPHALHYALKANSTLAILRAAPRAGQRRGRELRRRDRGRAARGIHSRGPGVHRRGQDGRGAASGPWRWG